jgi:phosphatidylinositol-binding clathrin assembly protein
MIPAYPVPSLTFPTFLQQVVFKALLTLHTIIRNGATDNILAYLSTGDVLRLKNVSTPNWEGVPPRSRRQDGKTDDSRTGYNAPENLSNYATYLDTRIRAFRDLKHDAIRVQSENNRDLRNSAAIEDESLRRKGAPLQDRRKTMMGRKLRIMTVEKGLLRETKVAQKMVDSLCECRVCISFPSSPKPCFPYSFIVLPR